MMLWSQASAVVAKRGTSERCNGGCSSPLLAERAHGRTWIFPVAMIKIGSGSNKFCLAVLAWEDGASWRARVGRVRMIAQWETNQPSLGKTKIPRTRAHWLQAHRI